ncbi:MAG: hypothetical protein AB7S70_04845 [Hyphomicrobium sp.]
MRADTDVRKLGTADIAAAGEMLREHQQISIFGWLTLKEAAERKRLAGDAVHLLRRGNR